MADDGADEPAVESEQAHHVVRGERDRRGVVEIGAVRVVESCGAQGPRIELRMHPLGSAAAVLVGLDLHERGLGAAGQPRNRPGVRIGLPQRVHRSQDQGFLGLLAGGLPGDVPGQAGAGVRGGEGEQGATDGVDRGFGKLGHRHGVTQCGLEGVLEDAACRDHPGIPLETRIQLRKRAVGRRVEDEQAELDVVIPDHVVARGDGCGGEVGEGRGVVTATREDAEDGARQGAARREGDGGVGVEGGEGHEEGLPSDRSPASSRARAETTRDLTPSRSAGKRARRHGHPANT